MLVWEAILELEAVKKALDRLLEVGRVATRHAYTCRELEKRHRQIVDRLKSVHLLNDPDGFLNEFYDSQFWTRLTSDVQAGAESIQALYWAGR